jgi:hypothetical protein
MPSNLKIDIINGAYSQMRVSGLTVDPSAADLILSLRRLEGLANELYGRNVCTGYYFEEDPDINSPSGLDPKYWYAFECVLAQRLLSDFGKGMKPDPMLLKNASAGLSFLYSSTANPRQIQYPRRQSIGAGNALRRINKFYNPIPEAPNTCKTNRMIVGDIDNFVEHFESYLISPEEIASYTIEADTGLTIVSDSDTSPDIFYQIQADGGTSSDGLLRVKIVMTTDTGRVTTRIINFELTDSPEIE